MPAASAARAPADPSTAIRILFIVDSFQPWVSREASRGHGRRGIGAPSDSSCGKPAGGSVSAPMQPCLSSDDARSATGKEQAMKALVYHGPGERRWEAASDPAIEEPTDA